MAASVVVCTCARVELLRNCLASVSRLDPAPGEILVIDNTPGDAHTEAIAKEFNARYAVEIRPGLSHARNRAVELASGEIIAFLDDDAQPRENWLGLMLEPFEDANVAVVTGDTFPAEMAESAVSNALPRYISSKDPQWFEIVTYGGLGYGTNMALRKSACSGWKGFDVRLGRGAPLWLAEESHAFATLLSKGYTAVHVPAAIVIHPNKPLDLEKEASSSIAYWLLLFFEFPSHRLDLIRFLSGRLLRRRLAWSRNPQEPGRIIRGGWRLYFKAGIAGVRLYFRNRRNSQRR